MSTHIFCVYKMTPSYHTSVWALTNMPLHIRPLALRVFEYKYLNEASGPFVFTCFFQLLFFFFSTSWPAGNTLTPHPLPPDTS